MSRGRGRRKWRLAIFTMSIFPILLIALLSFTLFYASWYQVALVKIRMDRAISDEASYRVGGSLYYPDHNVYQQVIKEGKAGNVGTGVYDQALALLNNEYLKDLLSLYKDASSGKYDSYQYRLPASQYLSIHYNESGVYANMSPVPDGPFPVEGGKVKYNQTLGGLPKEAITWVGYNTNVMNVIGYGSIQPTNSGRDVFIFQMNKNSFTDQIKANINGYNTTSSRGPDPYFLADQCVRLNAQFTDMLNSSSSLKEAYKTNPTNVASIFNVRHNRGSVYQSAMGLAYLANGQRGALNVSSSDDAVYKESLRFGEDIQAAVRNTGYKTTSQDIDGSYNRALAVALLVKQGWYVSDATVNYYTNKHPEIFIKAWNNVYKSEQIQNATQVNNILSRYKRNLATELGISPDRCYQIYRTRGDYSEVLQNGQSYAGGVVFKIENYTSSLYTGGTSKQVHAYDVITAGHAVMGMNSDLYWETLMKYAMEESGIDPTDPRLQTSDSLNNEDSFKTKDQVAAQLLAKLGYTPKEIDPNAFDLISQGLKISGGWYSQSKRGQKDSNGDLFLDCSSLVGHAIAATAWGKTQSINKFMTTQTIFGELSYLKYVDKYNAQNPSAWKQKAKPGDIMVARYNGAGHTYIFVGLNKTQSAVTLPADLTKRAASVTVPPGAMVTIEAYSDGYRNGVFQHAASLKAGSYQYTIKRMKSVN